MTTAERLREMRKVRAWAGADPETMILDEPKPEPEPEPKPKPRRKARKVKSDD